MIDISTRKHIVAFPSRMRNAVATHLFDLELQENADNGELKSIGAYIKLGTYKAANAVSTFTGKIVEQASNGNWYIEVQDDYPDICFIYKSPKSAYAEDRLKVESLFYNDITEDDPMIKGYPLSKRDIFEISPIGFTGKPVVGKSVTFDSTTHKYVVGN